MNVADLLNTEYRAPAVEYTSEELAYRAKIIGRIENMRQQRDGKHPEFDDMDYQTYYETNARAANSYIPPKVNQDDTRIVTGTTHEKEVTLLSATLNYNLEPSVMTFDEHDLVIEDLGKNIEDMVKKSREIEDYDAKRPLFYKEIYDQGDVFIEETWSEYYSVDKGKVDWDDATMMKMKKVVGKLKKLTGICETRMLPGTMVYLGNIREFDERRQPDLAIVSLITYEDAASLYAEWERFANVPRQITRVAPTDRSYSYQDWTLQEVQTNMVEVIKYQGKFSNEYMIMLNGVLMLPVGFPLTAISPSGEYTITKGSIEPISSFFAYSKSVPAKTKVDQAVLDEMLRLIILKTQQSFKPPMANNTKRTLSKRIFTPGTIHNDIDPTRLTPIFPPTGVTPGEINAYQIIKSVIDEKTSSPVFSGQSASGGQTATEILELKKQSMMKLGLAIWGVVQLEKKLTWLRIQNIIANWTKVIDEEVSEVNSGLSENVYRTMTVDTDLDSGQRGRKIISFNPELANTLSAEQVRAEEDFLTAETGVITRKVYLNPIEFQKIKATFFVNITPTEKDSTELNRVMFTQNIRDAAAIFGVQSLNMEYLKERFAVLAKEDPAKYFTKAPEQPIMGAGMQEGAPQGGGQIAAQMMQGARPPQQPSLNTLTQAS